jgi:hypothetical protein
MRFVGVVLFLLLSCGLYKLAYTSMKIHPIMDIQDN